MMLKPISLGLTVAAFILAAAAALRYAEGLDMIAADSRTRVMQVLIGLILAAYANVMPRDIGRWRSSARAAATKQSVLRTGGWLLTLAGLAYAGIWAFTPIGFAHAAAKAVVGIATLVTAAYSVWALVMCRRTQDSPTKAL